MIDFVFLKWSADAGKAAFADIVNFDAVKPHFPGYRHEIRK